MRGLLGGGFFDPVTQGLLAAGGSILQASGPSRMPQSLGSIAGQGLLTGMGAANNAQQAQLANQMQALQMEGMRGSLDEAKRTREAIEAFAAQLPADKRGQFLANPAAYIKSATEGFTLSPGQTRYAGGAPIATSAPNLTFQDTGGGISGLHPQTGEPMATLPKTVTPDKAAGLGWEKFTFENQSADQRLRLEQQQREHGSLSMAQRVAAGQRDREIGISGLNTYHNTGMTLPGGIGGLPQVQPRNTPPFTGAPSIRPVSQGVPVPQPQAPGAAQMSPRQLQEIAAVGPKVTAEAQAKAAMDAPAAVAKAEQAISLVDQMIGDKGRPQQKGKVQREPHPGFSSVIGATIIPGQRFIHGTDAASFDALYEQVKGGAFLQAFETLKGAGQITEVEGRKATDAITRMQRSQTEDEFVKAAREFQDSARKGMQLARQRAGQSAPSYNGPERRGIPNGVDAAVWNVMTPEERALWR